MKSNRSSLTILHVTAPARIGGLESVVIGLAGGQRAAGHRVHTVAVVEESDSDHPFMTALREKGVEVHELVIASRAYRRERQMVMDLCRRVQPDVVHTHGHRPDVVDGPVARRLGIPTVTTAHGFARGKGWKSRVGESIQRRAFRQFDCVIAVSRPLAEELRAAGVSPDRVHLLSNAWSDTTARLGRDEARAALGLAPDALHVGWVGRFSPEKGASVLLSALGHLEDLPLSVSLVGEGRERGSLEMQAMQLKIPVRFHGAVEGAGRYFSAFDVFVLSSHTEGTPIVLFEAMAAGTPIVATRVGGVPDVVSPAEALLVPANDPIALAGAIREALTDGDGARARIDAARKRLQVDFDSAHWIRRQEALYRSVLRSVPVPR